jgi:hypothetical protein
MLTRDQERQIEARHLAQDLALEGADEDAIRGALSEGQFGDCLDDGEITHIISENAVVEHIELKQGNKSSHHVLRACGVAVMLAGGVVWYFCGFDIIPLGAIVFGFVLAWAPDKAFLDIF